MIDRIVAFGDSFTYGLVKLPVEREKFLEERRQVTSFGEYIASGLRKKFENTGICGAGNPTIANTVYNFEFKPGDFALISWSAVNRPFKWNRSKRSVDWQATSYDQYENIYMSEVSIRFIENYLQDYGVPYIMISAFQDYKTFDSGKFNNFSENWIEPTKFNNTLFDIVALRWLNSKSIKYKPNTTNLSFDVSNEFIAPCKHPSEKGHKLIAKTLTPYVRTAMSKFLKKQQIKTKKL